MLKPTIALTLLLAVAEVAPSEPEASAAVSSVCLGTTRHGRLRNGVPLPERGANFETFSAVASGLGRTHVHSTVRAIVVDAYAALATELPDRRFVFGETGWPEGGRLRPHRTHQNGTSVDFMVPVLDARGRPTPLPIGLFNELGYGLEFDAAGRLDDLRIDFAAVAAHLFQLDRAARRHGSSIRLVIFAPELIAQLNATPWWPRLEQRVPFMRGRPWIRHDEHYHVDFAIGCQPLATR